MQTVFIIGIGLVVIGIFLVIVFTLRGTTQKGLENTLTKYGNVAVRTQNNIMNNNETRMRETATKTANIHKDAVKTIVHSVKEGLTEEDTIFCKTCGAKTDENSTFGKEYGKKL